MLSLSKFSMTESSSTEPELKHRVSVTISDPQHTMASKRGEKMEKKIRLYAKDEKHAQELAKHHFKKQGYKVHDSNYIGIVEDTENVNEISANTAMSYLHKTYDTKGYRDHTPQTKKGIERATKKVSQDAMRKDYERSSKLGLSTEEVKLDEASLTAGKRLISKHGEGSHTARVYKDTEYNEYQVHHYKDGKHMGEGPVSYHNDKEDAEATAKQSIKRRMKEDFKIVKQVDEVSMELLTRYKEKAGQQASAMNKAIPAVAASSAAPEHKKAAIDALVKKGNKRFSGIIKATNKQFAKATAKEEVEMNEAVTVKKQNYSWGKMITVHHGASKSYPLHPEHQKQISKLRPGDKTSFRDETGKNVHVHREGDKVHLMTKDSNYKPTTVDYKHFEEQSIKETVKRFVKEARGLAGMSVDQLKQEHEKVKRKIESEGKSKMISMNHPLSQRARSIRLQMLIKQKKQTNEAPETYSQSPTSVPFTGGTKMAGTVTDKSGAKHTPMSRAKHLAKMAASKEKKAAKGFKKFTTK